VKKINEKKPKVKTNRAVIGVTSSLVLARLVLPYLTEARAGWRHSH